MLLDSKERKEILLLLLLFKDPPALQVHGVMLEDLAIKAHQDRQERKVFPDLLV